MGTVRQYGLILPPDYKQNPKQRYPVIFLLHGGHDDASAWDKKIRIRPVLDNLFEVREGGHIFAALTGFFLLMLATSLSRRKRMAWLLTVILLIISILSNLLKGFDWEESLLTLVLLVQLIVMRDVFTAQSDRPSIAQGVKVLLGALLFTLAYGTAGFYLVDQWPYDYNFSLPKALYQTLAMFFTEDNAGLKPRTLYGHFFANSIYLVGAVTHSYALFMLLQPVLLRGEPATSEERHKAKEIVEQYGRSSLAHLTLLKDKSYYFSPSGRSVIAYVPKSRGAIAYRSREAERLRKYAFPPSFCYCRFQFCSLRGCR